MNKKTNDDLVKLTLKRLEKRKIDIATAAVISKEKCRLFFERFVIWIGEEPRRSLFRVVSVLGITLQYILFRQLILSIH